MFAGAESQVSDFQVVLLVEHSRDRQLLAEWLQGEFAVSTDVPGRPGQAGCLVVDRDGLERHQSRVESLVEEAAPVFLPVLYVTRDRDRVPPSVWEVADDIVEVPVNKAELENRLGVLLQSREQSLTLKQQQERSEHRFRTLFQTAPDPVVIVRPDGSIEDANDAFVSLVEVSHDDLVGTKVTDIGFEPEDRIERVLLRVADSANPEESTVSYVRPSGESVVSELNADVLTHLGDASERIGMFRDVTERRESRDDLERKVDRLDEFSSIVAHDLRNPLTIAKGKLDLARDQCDVDELDDAAAALDRMDELIGNLLDFARVGTLVEDLSIVDLAHISEQSWGTVGDSSSTLVVDETAKIYADRDQLRRVFDNLFRNALEHTDPPVVVRVGPTDDGFYVEDDGPGIPANDRETVFAAEYTTQDGGSGLGLSIVRDITQAHGWSVEIEDGADGGTRFVFRDVSLAE